MLQPHNDSWAAIVYPSDAEDAERLGTALVIDGCRLLTCFHVVSCSPEREFVWIAFPKALGYQRGLRKASIIRTDAYLDVALLHVTEGVPPGVTAPPLRCPSPDALRDKPWWAFGFAGSQRGNSAHGLVGESLGDGYVRIDADPTSTYRLRRGFSGSGIWSPDFGAVVGLVVTADEHGNGEAVTVDRIDRCFPEENLRLLTDWVVGDVDETALAAWGWELGNDPEGPRHWRPRARGVSSESELGFRFRGRSAALTAITSWLDRDLVDRRALVVTGSPGAGKSAVLGRIVTTADPSVVAALPETDQAVRASPRSVACAVHARGKTALEVATEIARAASAVLPIQVDDFAPALRNSMVGRANHRFNVVIDALDEASDPNQAREIVTKVILPLVETCADVGVQVVVGSRSSDSHGDLLAAFAESLVLLDLDNSELFSADDLKSYALAMLQLEGNEREGNPYSDETVAAPVAARVAELSARNFLIAGLMARSHGLHDQEAADPRSLSFTASVDYAMQAYLHPLSPVGDVPVDAVLTALAFMEAPGISLELWLTAVQALDVGKLTRYQLARFACSSAASFLIESGPDNGVTVFRLFHQALNDTLLRARAHMMVPTDDQRAITTAFLGSGRQHGWASVPGYLLRSLPAHAAAASMVDVLLTDDAYLLYADLNRLLQLEKLATTRDGRQRVRLLQLTPRAVFADAPNRTALFSVTEILENLGRNYADSDFPAPYKAKWSTAAPRAERLVLENTGGVGAVCSFKQNDRSLLACGDGNGVVHIWDLAVGTERATLRGHVGPVRKVCAFSYQGQTLLAGAGNDGSVRIWNTEDGAERVVISGYQGGVGAMSAFTRDGAKVSLLFIAHGRTIRAFDPGTGDELAAFEGRTGFIKALCAFTTHDGRALLAFGDANTVRIWDLRTRTELLALEGHEGEVVAMCSFTRDGRTLLASGSHPPYPSPIERISEEPHMRVWDPVDGTALAAFQADADRIGDICAFSLDGEPVIATGGSYLSVRIWSLANQTEQATLRGHNSDINCLCSQVLDGQVVLASGSSDGTARIWDQADMRSATTAGRSNGNRAIGNRAICTFVQDGESLIATGGDDKKIRIWDPVTGTQRGVMSGEAENVRELCAFTLNGRTMLVSGGSMSSSFETTVRIWDAVTGAELMTLYRYTNSVSGVSAFTHGDRTLVASSGFSGIMHIWDPLTGGQLAVYDIKDRVKIIPAMCAFTYENRGFLACSDINDAIRIWDVATANELSLLEGHAGMVGTLCSFTLDGHPRLASSTSGIGIIRIWDPIEGVELKVLPGHAGSVHALASFDVNGRTLLASGGTDRIVRIWDPVAGNSLLAIPIHYPSEAIGFASGHLISGGGAGLLAIKLELELTGEPVSEQEISEAIEKETRYKRSMAAIKSQKSKGVVKSITLGREGGPAVLNMTFIDENGEVKDRDFFCTPEGAARLSVGSEVPLLKVFGFSVWVIADESLAFRR